MKHSTVMNEFNEIIEKDLLGKYLQQGQPIRVLVIDDFPAIFTEFTNMNSKDYFSSRGNYLRNKAQEIKSMALQYNFAVLIINHVIDSFE